MKFLKTLTVLILSIFLTLTYSCEKDPNTDPNNNDTTEVKEPFFDIDGVTYSEFNQFIQSFGKYDSLGIYSHWLQFTSKDVVINVTENDVVEYDGEGYVLIIGVYTDIWGGISEGTYTLNTTSEPTLLTYEASYFKIGGGEFIPAESGDVSVSRNNDEYEIEFELTDENSETIAVYYKGKIDFHYDREAYFYDERDGQLYDLVKIGDQVWFQRNYAYQADTNCWLMDEPEATVEKYGYLYTVEKAIELTPDGFRLPTEDDFFELDDYVDDNYEGTENDEALLVGGVTGFDAYQYGHAYSYSSGNFLNRNIAAFWTSTESSDVEYRAYAIGFWDSMNQDYYQYMRYTKPTYETYGLSVRYLKE